MLKILRVLLCIIVIGQESMHLASVKKNAYQKKNRSQFETKVSVLGSVQANCVKFKRQKSEFFEKSINLGGQKKLSQAMRDSQQTSSNAVRKNEEPRAEKIGVIQA